MFDNSIDVSKVGDDVLEREYSRLEFWLTIVSFFALAAIVSFFIVFFILVNMMGIVVEYPKTPLTVLVALCLFGVGAAYHFVKVDKAMSILSDESGRRALHKAYRR
jgi:hypothetical protein